MSLPKKGSRKLEVDGAPYRWTIRKKPSYGQAIRETPMTLAVEPLEGDGKLSVTLGVSRPDNWIQSHQTSVTPKVVRKIIETALGAGWEPGSPGTFVLQYPLIQDQA